MYDFPVGITHTPITQTCLTHSPLSKNLVEFIPSHLNQRNSLFNRALTTCFCYHEVTAEMNQYLFLIIIDGRNDGIFPIYSTLIRLLFLAYICRSFLLLANWRLISCDPTHLDQSISPNYVCHSVLTLKLMCVSFYLTLKWTFWRCCPMSYSEATAHKHIAGRFISYKTLCYCINCRDS